MLPPTIRTKTPSPTTAAAVAAVGSSTAAITILLRKHFYNRIDGGSRGIGNGSNSSGSSSGSDNISKSRSGINNVIHQSSKPGARTRALSNNSSSSRNRFVQVLLLTWAGVLLHVSPTGALDIATCKNPLGMESGAIADFQITASSAHDMGNVGPQHARLKIDNNGGAWCPKHMVSRGLKEYLQIDLLQVHVITSIRTQGRFGKGQGQEYTEAYVLEYWRPGFTNWIRWKNIQGKEILPGNINTYSEVENVLQPIIFASKIRIYPYSQYDRTVCLRAEVVGCPWEGHSDTK